MRNSYFISCIQSATVKRSMDTSLHQTRDTDDTVSNTLWSAEKNCNKTYMP